MTKRAIIASVVIIVAACTGMKGCKSPETGHRLPVKSDKTWHLEEPNEWLHIGPQLGPNWVQIGWTIRGRPVWLRRHQ